MSAHTEGPWELTERSGYYEILAPDSGCSSWYGRKGVSAVAYADTERDEQEANARLISAAPDLLYVATLVTELTSILGEKNAVVLLAHKAIAKAVQP